MTRIVWLLSISVLLFFVQGSSAAGIDHVVIVSMDGGKPASIFKSKMPTLKSLVEEGSSTFRARTIFPSKTLPSHVSMLTGVPPTVHKITWNYWNPFKGAVKVPTVFSVAKLQGLSTALFATKSKFRHIKVKHSLDEFSLRGKDAISVANLAAEYLSANKPNLLFVHMPDSDKAGHTKGWESADQLQALERVDSALGTLRNAIAKSYEGSSYAMIVTADHGGTGTGHGSASDDDTNIPWIAWGNVVKEGYALENSINTMDTAATALWLLDLPFPDGIQGNPVVDAFN